MWGWKVFWSANLSNSKATKMKLLRTLVMSVLLYGAEIWITAQKDLRKLRMFHMKCLLGVTCWDKIRNETILHRAIKVPMKVQLRKTGQQYTALYVVAAGSVLIKEVSLIERFHCIALYSMSYI